MIEGFPLNREIRSFSFWCHSSMLFINGHLRIKERTAKIRRLKARSIQLEMNILKIVVLTCIILTGTVSGYKRKQPKIMERKYTQQRRFQRFAKYHLPKPKMIAINCQGHLINNCCIPYCFIVRGKSIGSCNFNEKRGHFQLHINKCNR